MFFYGVMMYFLFSKNWFLFIVVIKVIFIIFVKVCLCDVMRYVIYIKIYYVFNYCNELMSCINDLC